MRDYIIRRMADIDENVNGEDYLGRTVYEEHELIDIGIVDQNGDRIMARKHMDPIGFVRFPDRG
ncbi:MAG: hypothetical protein ACTHJQ_22715 [Rhizobiaceae bacterium]